MVAVYPKSALKFLNPFGGNIQNFQNELRAPECALPIFLKICRHCAYEGWHVPRRNADIRCTIGFDCLLAGHAASRSCSARFARCIALRALRRCLPVPTYRFSRLRPGRYVP